jgi:hypothetical protein
MKIGIPKRLAKILGPVIALGICCAAVAISRSVAASMPYQTTKSADPSGVEDTDEQRGPFAIGEQNYTVVLHFKRLTAATDPLFKQTLADLGIRDTEGNVAYEKSFPLAATGARLLLGVSVSVDRLSGNTGAGLLLRYVERSTALQTAQSQTNEFWQLFGLVNGKLAPLAKPALIGEPDARGPYMGVIMRAANGTVSVVGQPDTIEVRAWTGNFYVFIPLRVDWNHGGLAQGQRCVERLASPLQDVGCPMRVEASRRASAEEFGFVRLFTEAHENFGTAEHVVLQKDSKVEILGSSAITTWNENGGRIRPVFSDVWLHVRIDSHDGWIHGEDDFTAVGLPAESPAP